MTDTSNPFEDPDVQSGINSTNPNDNAYGDTSWQNDVNDTQQQQQTNEQNYTGPPAPPTNVYDNDMVQDTAINMGTTAVQNVGNDIADDYNQTAKNNQNQHGSPPPPNWCEKCMYWFPLQWFNFFGGFITALFAVIDIIFRSEDTSFIGYIIYFYLVFFGFIIMFVEAPSFKLTRSTQVSLYFWFRFLSRLWGRGWFYLFVALLCMGELNDNTNSVNASAFAGFFLVVMATISWIVSRAAAKKYQRFFVFIAAGTEGEEREKKFTDKFKELDMDQDGYLVAADIVKLAEQAGRDLANSERHCIQTFLDESCNGRVALDDWSKMFRDYNMKQRFL